ncbi:MAG: methylated-DNA--[protein]-cysteine S-methyltransferase [Geminicoccaceae bacterium]
MVALHAGKAPGPGFLIDRVESPIGTILLVADGEALRALEFADDQDETLRQFERRAGPRGNLAPARDPAGLATRVRAYFAGEVDAFEGVAVRAGGTPFQREVWAALREIPPGRTTSYGQLAARLGRPGSSRAVGLANGANPIAIILPCHRVIGANGKLVGYGGGLPRKEALLAFEAAVLASGPRSFPELKAEEQVSLAL